MNNPCYMATPSGVRLLVGSLLFSERWQGFTLTRICALGIISEDSKQTVKEF